MSVSQCPACGGSGPIHHDDVTDHTFGTPGTWQLRRCNSCASLWLDPRPTDEDLPRAYATYYTHGTGDASAAPGGARAKAIVRHLPGHRDDKRGDIAYLEGLAVGRALDVGCGDGRTVIALQNAGWQCIGIDPDPQSIEAAKRSGAIDVRVGTLDTIEDIHGSFDAIVSVHSLEHVPDVRQSLQDAHALLRPGGTIVVVTPNAQSWLHQRHGDRWRGLEAPRHLQIFSPTGLDRVLTELGFAEVNVFTSARGTNGIARAYRSTTQRGDRRWHQFERYFEGELVQAAEALRLRVHPLSGEELVAIARRR